MSSDLQKHEHDKRARTPFSQRGTLDRIVTVGYWLLMALLVVAVIMAIASGSLDSAEPTMGFAFLLLAFLYPANLVVHDESRGKLVASAVAACCWVYLGIYFIWGSLA